MKRWTRWATGAMLALAASVVLAASLPTTVRFGFLKPMQAYGDNNYYSGT